MASKAQRDGITVLKAAPALAMRFTGRMAPENNTAGKHNIGRASVAWATLPTRAEGSRPRPRAAVEHNRRVTPIEAYVDSGRVGRRSKIRSTPSMAVTTTSRKGTRMVTFDAT